MHNEQQGKNKQEEKRQQLQGQNKEGWNKELVITYHRQGKKEIRREENEKNEFKMRKPGRRSSRDQMGGIVDARERIGKAEGAKE